MKCSILINNFNYAAFVEECLQSAVDQTHEDLEIIIVDDGSTDESKKLISEFAERSHRPIQIVFKENGGQASALNEGFCRSHGDIIFFLDADDVLAPDCAQRVVANWTEGTSKFHFGLAVIDDESAPTGRMYRTKRLPRGDLRDSILKTGIVDSNPTSGNAFSRIFLQTVMPIPEEKWRFNADVFLCNQAALAGQVSAIDDPIGYYRMHGKNGSAHTNDGKCNKRAIRRDLFREIQTNDVLTTFSKALDLLYEPDALKRTFGHKQIVLVYTSIFDSEFSPKGIWAAYSSAMYTLFEDGGLSTFKKAAIGIWQTAAVILPKGMREKLIVWGYRNGFVVSKDKMIERAQS